MWGEGVGKYVNGIKLRCEYIIMHVFVCPQTLSENVASLLNGKPSFGDCDALGMPSLPEGFIAIEDANDLIMI